MPGGEGLSDYGARWYDARLGRFLSADTVVPGAMNPQALNRYSYVYNRPTGLTDPSGHEPGGCYTANQCPLGEYMTARVHENNIPWDNFFLGWLGIRGYVSQPGKYSSDRMQEQGIKDGDRDAAFSRLTNAYVYAAYSSLHLSTPQLDALLLDVRDFDQFIDESHEDPYKYTGALLLFSSVLGLAPGNDGIPISKYSGGPYRTTVVKTDGYHRFPALVDYMLLDGEPLLVRLDGRREFILKGSFNNTEGAFHITLGSDGRTIIHRQFTEMSDWKKYSSRWALPQWEKIP